MTSIANFTVACCCHKHTLELHDLLAADINRGGGDASLRGLEAAGKTVWGHAVSPSDHDTRAHLENLLDQAQSCPNSLPILGLSSKP
jgi:hypothetical protein